MVASTRPVCPSVCGWKAEERRAAIPRQAHTCPQNWEANWGTSVACEGIWEAVQLEDMADEQPRWAFRIDSGLTRDEVALLRQPTDHYPDGINPSLGALPGPDRRR